MRHRAPAFAAAAFLLAACATAEAPPAPDTAALAPPPGYSLVWADEFDRDGLPDPARWAYDTTFNKRGWHNEEKQYYADARLKNSRAEGGRLIIEAHLDEAEISALPDWGGQRYSSARLVTRGKESWKYGYFEARAKLPCGLGTWPAIWTLAAVPNMKWPDDGEIDIMEHVAQEPGVVHQTIHTDAFNHVEKTQKEATVTVPDACDAFHLYQLHWTADRIRMGVDGKQVFDFARPSNDAAEWPFDKPHYLLLNLAVGGWGGLKGIDDGAFPQRFEIDYVRVWQAD
ncbi:MAG: family 16 glycosylhydrolase [Allosphingosinicella sp.]